MDFLNDLRDKEGLIDNKHITLDEYGAMYIKEEPVRGVRQIEKIINILKNHQDLWSKSKFSLEKQPKEIRGIRGGAGAPIIGVPFSIALENIINGEVVQKSMFYIDDDLTNKGLEGRLIANYRKNTIKTEIAFQLWEVLPLDLPTYFIHGIYNIEQQIFTHFDGALIPHDEDIKKKMQWNAYIPPKVLGYQKLFRLDGIIPIKIVMELMYHYLPLEDLSREYGAFPPIKEEIIE